MRRALVTLGFGIAGLLSVIAWASIDAQLCDMFLHLCVPRVGECGGGLDACAITVRTYVDLTMYLVGPPFVFAWLGHCLEATRTRWLSMGRYLFVAVLVHWGLMFAGTRLLHI
jgi:hypothetical protein